jgi:hypothetical protein
MDSENLLRINSFHFDFKSKADKYIFNRLLNDRIFIATEKKVGPGRRGIFVETAPTQNSQLCHGCENTVLRK